MKKIIGFIAVFALSMFAVNVQAQALRPVNVTTTAYGAVLDTVDNTEAHTTTAFPISEFKHGFTAQVIVTKISGTVGGSIGLYGSMDGTNLTLIGSATTPSDASANYSFNTTVGWKYFAVRYTGTGTMSASMRTYVMPY